MLVFSELVDGFYDLGGGKERKLSKIVRVSLASASASVLSTKKMDDGCHPCAEASQGQTRSFDLWSSEGGVRTEKSVVADGICFVTSSSHFFVEAFDGKEE